jgi:hypothetical protein
MLTTSIQMDVELRKIGRIFLGYLCKKVRKEPSPTKQINIASEGTCQAGAAAEAHSSLHTACTMEVT